jgi:hypothetical protein
MELEHSGVGPESMELFLDPDKLGLDLGDEGALDGGIDHALKVARVYIDSATEDRLKQP